MSSSPPPPPQLPSIVTGSVFNAVNKSSSSAEDIQCIWKRISARADEDECQSQIWYIYNAAVTSVLQDGPKCGLVALCMATEMLSQDASYSVNAHNIEEVYQAAKHAGFTCQGEMFSAMDMGRLAEQFCGCCSKVEDKFPDKLKLIQHLLHSFPILVPYDADCNHEPCCKLGHKAHWAVLTGFLIGTAQPMPSGLNENCQQDENIPTLYHLKCKSRFPLETDTRCLYLLAKQGKSRHLQAWKYEDLKNSNSQLLYLDPERAIDIDNYILPTKGVEDGLCSKTVFLSPVEM